MTWTIKNPVVVPFDFSDHAKEAIRKSLGLAESRSQIHVLHVLPFLIPTEPGVVWGVVDDQERVESVQDALQATLAAEGWGDLQTVVRFGDPGQIIADYAESLAADLIVVGSHGRTGLSRLVLGSVAERVTRLAHCPVLVVKLPTEPVTVDEKSETEKSKATSPSHASVTPAVL